MSDYFPSPRNKGKDPEGIYLSPKTLVYTIVILIFCFIIVFLLGVYFGRKDVLTTLAKNEITVTETPEITTKTNSKPDDSQTTIQTSPTTTDNTQGNTIPTSTTGEPSTVQSVPQTFTATDTATITDQPKTPTASDTTSIPDQLKTPTASDTTSIQNQPRTTTTTETTDSPSPKETTAISENKPQDQVPTELIPITPPIGQDINSSDKSNTVSDKTPTKTNIKQNPKTFSIQLSALSGDDAESRAKALVEKMKNKYSQFQFRIQPAGKFYKISVINLSDEKTAKEALKILSQEPNFKKAFIVKPKK